MPGIQTKTARLSQMPGTRIKTARLSQVPEAQTGQSSPMLLQRKAKTLVVHICGAVSAPGVYELPAGSRIIDAVEAGGGFLPEADEACCNLAEEIVDGCQIYIMTKTESCADGQTEKKAGIQTSPDSDMQTTDRNVRSNSATALENGLVNLNTADVAALMTLPGIGESRAKAIISYREQHGAFAQIEDIMKISGIKQAAFSKIKDKITV